MPTGYFMVFSNPAEDREDVEGVSMSIWQPIEDRVET